MVPIPYVLMVVGGEQLLLHNTNSLVDTHTQIHKLNQPHLDSKSHRLLISVTEFCYSRVHEWVGGIAEGMEMLQADSAWTTADWYGGSDGLCWHAHCHTGWWSHKPHLLLAVVQLTMFNRVSPLNNITPCLAFFMTTSFTGKAKRPECWFSLSASKTSGPPSECEFTSSNSDIVRTFPFPQRQTCHAQPFLPCYIVMNDINSIIFIS